jgi:hypothetical protein
MLQHLMYITKTVGNQKHIDYYSGVQDATGFLTPFASAKIKVHQSASKVI